MCCNNLSINTLSIKIAPRACAKNVLLLLPDVLCCAAQAILKRYPEILRNLRPLPGSLDVRDVPRTPKPWPRQRRRQQQEQHWLSAAAGVLPVNLPPGAAAGRQQQSQKVKQQPGLPSQDELQVRFAGVLHVFLHTRTSAHTNTQLASQVCTLLCAWQHHA